ncbi:MAG: class E sortase, partial [Actinomycetota bacterium]|nr:class E sortase [Actinomycetota bacterium]
MLLFVAYELWGTNLQEASSQRHLKKEFSALLRQRDRLATRSTTTTPSSTSTSTSTSTSPTPSTTAATPATPATGSVLTVPRTTPAKLAPANLPLPEIGDPVAIIQIPKIGVGKAVVQGVTLDQLKRGPGHYPESPLPGQKGNVAIAGHRTTYGAPFHDIDGLKPGDDIVVTTLQGTFHYKVDSTLIVAPSDLTVLADKGDNRLTLTSCNPRYSARQRIVVSGVLVGAPVARLKGQDRTASGRSRLPGENQANRIRIDGGIDGTKSSKLPAFVWGGVCAVVWLLAWVANRL